MLPYELRFGGTLTCVRANIGGVQSCGGLRSQYSLNAGVKDGVAGKDYDRVLCKNDTVAIATDVNKLCQEGRLKEALQIVNFMVKQGIGAPVQTYACLLQGCSRMKALSEGKQLHAHVVKSGLESSIFLKNHLVNMYAKCGSLLDARLLFDVMPERDVSSWAAIIAAYAKQGQCKEAVNLFQQMQWAGVVPDKFVYLSVLKACGHLAALELGRQVHAQIIETGFVSDVFVGSTLVNMYAKCGSIEDACRVFHKMPQRDVVSWNAMIAGYAHQGYAKEALTLFEQMQHEGRKPDNITFVSVLKACTILGALECGKQIHAHIIQSSFESDIFVGSTLIDMYAKCGSIKDAWRVFSRLRERNVVSWNVMIAGYAQQANGQEALRLFEQMQSEGVKPNNVTFISILKACASLEALDRGRQIHVQVIECGYESDLFVGSTLVDMYAKCGSIEDARQVFSRLQKQNVVSWNAMLAGYSHLGYGQKAFLLYKQMHQAAVKPDSTTFVIILRACANLEALEWGKEIHADAIQAGFESNVFVGNTLVDMYAKCGSIEVARQLFSRMCERDVVSWNVIIAGYAQQGPFEEALTLFEQMQQEGVKPDNVTFLSILKACASVATLETGKKVHAYIIKSGVESNVFVESTLVDMYAKCGSIDDARQVFSKMRGRNVVSWNAMIAGCAQQGYDEEAFVLFDQMLWEDVKPNNITLVSILKACASVADLERGKVVHAYIIRNGYESDPMVGSILVVMYAKCGSIEDACRVFEAIHERDAVSWTAMIAGYAQQGYGEEALTLFEQMQEEGVKPDNVTIVSVLKACTNLAVLQWGKQVHAHAIKNGFESDASVGNALVDMYAKCGSIEDARQLFDQMHERDVVSWTVMIVGYAQQGNGKEVLSLFDQMQHEGVKPNTVTFVSTLSACSHAGLVDEGINCFVSMTQDDSITPTVEHYACMVDLLGRAGHLEEAEYLINKMPIQPDNAVWMALLAACRNQGNVELGRLAFECLLKLEPKSSSAHILLSNIYAACGRWDDVTRIREETEDGGVKKEIGHS